MGKRCHRKDCPLEQTVVRLSSRVESAMWRRGVARQAMLGEGCGGGEREEGSKGKVKGSRQRKERVEQM